MKPPSDEPDFPCLVVDVFVEIRCVGSCRDKHNNESVCGSGLHVALLDPIFDLATIGRITENSLPPPFFRKSIIFNRIVLFAFCVFVGATRVEVEMELRVELLEEVVRRGPLVRVR